MINYELENGTFYNQLRSSRRIKNKACIYIPFSLIWEQMSIMFTFIYKAVHMYDAMVDGIVIILYFQFVYHVQIANQTTINILLQCCTILVCNQFCHLPPLRPPKFPAAPCWNCRIIFCSPPIPPVRRKTLHHILQPSHTLYKLMYHFNPFQAARVSHLI